VDLLANAPVELAWRAEDWLGRIAGEQSPLPVPIASDDPAARKRWRESWQAWWKANESKPDLARATQDGLAPGLTIVCEVDGVGKFPGRVCAFDRGGNLRWRVEGFDSPADVQLLRSGRILIAEFWTNRVTERDRSGQILWERKVNNHPVTAIRLRNGNTLIATSDEVFELDPNGKAIFNYKHTGSSIYCACKQRDGHVLFIDGSGKVSELNEAGKPVRTFVAERHASGASYWASIEPLPNGRYLMCLSGANMVVETDAAGKIHWECSVPAATYATRLGNGNTLVANSNGRVVVEVDRAGKEVWKQTTKGRPFRARRS